MSRHMLVVAGILILLGLGWTFHPVNTMSAQEPGGKFTRTKDGKGVDWNVNYAAPQLIRKWEYKIKDFNNSQHLEGDLNELGDDGWELVRYEHSVGIFKRLKQ